MWRGALALIGAVIGLLTAANLALAAPDRLDDKIPDATPDLPGAFAFSLGHEWLDMDGALTSQTTNHSMFRARYQFNPKVAAAVCYQVHDLAGGNGLLSPLFNQQDSANVWDFDLTMNLLNTPAEPADAGVRDQQ